MNSSVVPKATLRDVLARAVEADWTKDYGPLPPEFDPLADAYSLVDKAFQDPALAAAERVLAAALDWGGYYYPDNGAIELLEAVQAYRNAIKV